MKQYDEYLEELLLQKSFAELSALERRRVLQGLGGEAEYESARRFRLRTRALLAAEVLPADPGGWADVRERVGRRPVQIPLWQAAAAVLLAILLSWWGRGWWSAAGTEPEEKFYAEVKRDTIWQEVLRVDTLLWSPEEPDVTPEPRPIRPAPPKETAPRRKTSPRNPRLEADLAALASPELVSQSARGIPAGEFRPSGLEPVSDRFGAPF